MILSDFVNGKKIDVKYYKDRGFSLIQTLPVGSFLSSLRIYKHIERHKDHFEIELHSRTIIKKDYI